MKIERVDTYVLKTPLGRARFYSSQAEFPERNSLLVRLTSSDGLVGWGEGGQYGPAEPVIAASVTRCPSASICSCTRWQMRSVWPSVVE